MADAFIGWNAAGTALRNLTSADLASLTTLGTSYIYNVQADFGALGDTSTLADPGVVTDLIDNRQNKKG